MQMTTDLRPHWAAEGVEQLCSLITQGWATEITISHSLITLRDGEKVALTIGISNDLFPFLLAELSRKESTPVCDLVITDSEARICLPGMVAV